MIEELGRRLDRAWTSELVADVRIKKLYDQDGERWMDLTFVQHESDSEMPVLKKSFRLQGE